MSRKCRPVSRTASCAQQLPRNQRANNVLTEPALFIHVRLSPLRLLQTHFSPTRSQIWRAAEAATCLYVRLPPVSTHQSALCLCRSSVGCTAILVPTGNVGLQAMTIKMVVHISTAATTHLLSAALPPLSAPLLGNLKKRRREKTDSSTSLSANYPRSLRRSRVKTDKLVLHLSSEQTECLLPDFFF